MRVHACVHVLCRRGCGRKRKGTPVKVFVSNTEEESVSEHSFSPGLCLLVISVEHILNVCLCIGTCTRVAMLLVWGEGEYTIECDLLSCMCICVYVACVL